MPPSPTKVTKVTTEQDDQMFKLLRQLDNMMPCMQS